MLLEVCFLVVFWSWVALAVWFLRMTFLPRLPLVQTPDAFGLPSDTVEFAATDGLPLHGWKIPADAGRPWIIMCHGLGTNRADLLDIAAALHRMGYNLFLFDFRAHGASAGRATSFGYVEQRDLEGALAYLGAQPDIAATSYGVYGISMGGAVALLVAARDERIGAVAVDSPYANLYESMGRHLRLMLPLPKVPFLWFVAATYRLRFGIWPWRVDPAQAASKLQPRPLLIIQGGDDARMPVAGARMIHDRAGAPKELWIVEGAAHLEGFSREPEEYVRRLDEVFSGVD